MRRLPLRGGNMNLKSQLFDEKSIERAIMRISHEIIERNEVSGNIVLVGIKTRGVPIANRISDSIYNRIDSSIKIPVGMLDITDYRDDIEKSERKNTEEVNSLPDVVGKTVVLVDDVIYTGRTIRAALDAVTSVGRPAKIQLAVLVDRGHRELPIRPDYIGKNIPTSKTEMIQVHLKETDGEDVVGIYEK